MKLSWLCLLINKHWEIFLDPLLFYFIGIDFRMAFGVIALLEKAQPSNTNKKDKKSFRNF